MQLLITFHSLFRWAVLAALVGVGLAGLWKWRRGASWRAGSDRPLVLATVILDVQVATGILLWVLERAWATQGFFFRVLHPVAMLAAVAVAHVAVARGKARRDPVGYALAGGGLLLALVIVILAIPRSAWF